MRKTSDIVLGVILFLVSTVILVWFAVWLAPVIDTRGLSYTMENFNNATLNPLSLTWCSNTPKFILVALIIEAFTGIFIFANHDNTRAGEEHGSARLRSPQSIRKYLADKDFFKNRILSQNIRLSITGRKAPISLNSLVIGGMGSGKSFFVLLSNILQANTSLVITDPARQLVKATGWFLKHIKHYRVVVLDLIDLWMSTKYNFFDYIHNELDIEQTVNMLFKSTVEKEKRKSSSTDPMWELMAQDMLYAYIALIYYRGLESEQNIKTLVYLMEEDFLLQDAQGNRIRTPVMDMFDQLDEEIPNNVATRKYRSATEGEVVTIRGVKSTLRGRIGKFLLSPVQNLMARDEMHLDRIGKEKTALFLCVSTRDDSLNFVVSLLYSQLFNELYEQAEKSKDEHLEVPVQFLMDEMKNFAVPDEFNKYLTTGRKHWMSYMMFFQEKGQIDEMFGKGASELIGTCNTFVYLGDSGKDTNKYLSDWIGETTIDTKSQTISYGRGGSSSNRSKTKRLLFTPDEIDTKIPVDECLVYTSRKGWSQDKKFNPLKHPNYKYTAQGEEGQEFDYSGRDIVYTSIDVILTTRERERKPDISIEMNAS